MGIATNLILIVLGINLILVVFGQPQNASPMLGIVSAIFTQNVDWGYLLQSIISNAVVYGILIGAIVGISYLTGANPLTGGGGHGAILTLQVLAIAIFSSLMLMPNFSTFGMPIMVSFILNIVFGGLIITGVIGLLRGYD